MNYNYVEEKVDTSMINRLESKYPGVKGKISKANKHSKRMAIASILGNREIFELIKKTQEKQNTDEYLTYLDELVVLFRKYVEVADVEKKTLGEVMTPIWLVEDMLNTLPSEVWGNPNLKWLDPCAGVGTFPSIVVQRLMKGLENVIPNPEKRYGHIIENMIYVCELQDKNLFVFNCVFDLGDSNATNSYCGSFLDENFDNHMKNVWGIEKFDVIIGNPPYQKREEGNKKTQPIWQYFVDKSLDILNDGGHLNFVHPSGWRNVEGMFKPIQNKMKQYVINDLHLFGYSDGLKVFGAKTNYDYYCLTKTINNNQMTKITCVDKVIKQLNISKCEFIPNENIDKIFSLLAKEGEDKVVLIGNSSYHHQRPHMKKIKDNEFQYPCIQNVNVKNEISCLWYSNVNNKGHFNIPKVIFGRKSSGVMIDESGHYGMAEDCCSIVDDVNNLEDIKTALLNPIFISDVMNFKNNLGDKYNRKLISLFRKDFYKQFLND
jgi:hypothetical protein